MTNLVDSTQAVTSSTITVETLPVLTWNNQAVITTEFLAAVYGASEKQILQNFNNNKDRFIEGVHFFKLTGNDLREFRSCIDNIDLLQIHKNTASFLLFSERGAVRHAKILETEQAWAVQEKLEDCYFSKALDKQQGNPMDAINKDSKKYIPAERRQVTKLMNEYFDLGNLIMSRGGDRNYYRGDTLYSAATRKVTGRHSVPIYSLEEHEKMNELMAKILLHFSFPKIIDNPLAGDEVLCPVTNSPVSTLPIIGGQVTINSAPNVRYLVEQDEYGNASIRAIKHDEQICSRDQAVKDLVGEGRLVVLPLERYRHNSNFKHFLTDVEQIKNTFQRRTEYSAAYSPAQRARDTSVRRRELDYDEKINAIFEKLTQNVINAFNDVDAGISQIMDGLEMLTGYEGALVTA